MARSALIRRLAGTSWGASTPTLRTSTLALVYAPAEYCAPVWCRSAHSKLVDVSLNAALRTITGCLRPTQVEQLPVLAEIAPPALRREAATLVLGRRACQHDHLLHDVVENSNHRKRLKSRRPLSHHAQQLVSSVPPQETVKHWTHARWAESWASTTTRLHKFIPTPSNSGQGVGLSRRAWTRLNRLRTGVGRFGANMLRWGLSTNDSCECGAEQTADHITSGRCPIYRPPEGINGLIVLDDETRAWLENNALDICVVRDGTRKKNVQVVLWTSATLAQHCARQVCLLALALTSASLSASTFDDCTARGTSRWKCHPFHIPRLILSASKSPDLAGDLPNFDKKYWKSPDLPILNEDLPIYYKKL